jgi:hypothetical protein
MLHARIQLIAHQDISSFQRTQNFVTMFTDTTIGFYPEPIQNIFLTNYFSTTLQPMPRYLTFLHLLIRTIFHYEEFYLLEYKAVYSTFTTLHGLLSQKTLCRHSQDNLNSNSIRLRLQIKAPDYVIFSSQLSLEQIQIFSSILCSQTPSI